jgi:hypothetical protein
MVITVCSKPEVQWVAPRRADLMWGLGCRSSFEPRRRQDPRDGRFARKPTTVVAGHSGDTPVGILDATSPSRRASHPPSGQYAPMRVMVGPWPWSLLNLLSVAVWVLAVISGWHSADRVLGVNRPWTRAWRILVATIFGVGLNGIWVPVGAFYVAIKYRPAGPRLGRSASSTFARS